MKPSNTETFLGCVLKRPVDSKKAQEILDGLGHSTYESLSSSVKSFTVVDRLDEASRARSNLSLNRSKGVKKVGAGFQRLVVSFNHFLRSCKGIVDIASTADPAFVGVAYESLSILFSVRYLACCKTGGTTLKDVGISEQARC